MTSTPAQQRLTDEQIASLAAHSSTLWLFYFHKDAAKIGHLRQFARAIEREVLAAKPVAAPVAPDFIRQIAEAKRRVAEWPQWMQDAARIAVAAFPQPPQDTQTKGEVR